MHRIILFVLLLSAASLHADEGMWLLNHPPRDLLKERYQFDLAPDWLERVQKASIRFNNGGSGSFVSPEGLVVTNHHIGADSIQKLSSKGKDLYRDGFLAKTRAEELPCPDLELNVLDSIVDVTKDVEAALKPEMSPAEAFAARRAAIARISKESLEKTGLRSDVVTLYHGGLYHLYRYKKYTDVRLVMAPEHSIAFLGGDADNFEYPRYNLDVCFFRVYENGQPANTPHFLPWSKTGPQEGDLVFVSGHPGTTNRLETYERLIHRRDWTLPYTLNMLRQREALLIQHAEKGPEQRRHANRDLFSIANARKALTGQYQGLLDPEILKAKKAIEAKYRTDDPMSPWKKVAAAQQQLFTPGTAHTSTANAKAVAQEKLYFLIERGDAFDSRLFRIARHLVRLADDLQKNDGDRLAEYRSAGLESLKFQLFSPAPIDAELERVKLAASLSFLAEHLGGGEAFVDMVLANQSPAERAAGLVNGSKLGDVAYRKQLFEGGAKAIEASKDPMILFAKLIDPHARQHRQKYDEIEETQQQAYAGISKILFQKFGMSVPPDATFTLRLAFGVVKGYSVDGEKLPYATTFAGAYARSVEHGNKEPNDLPKSWLDAKAKVDPKTPFNFVATSDTIGGNSGSPVLNRKGELVGVNFDRNRHGLVRNFVYTEEQARHISVHSAGVLQALDRIYGATSLVSELTK